jgi:hypothetical protein
MDLKAKARSRMARRDQIKKGLKAEACFNGSVGKVACFETRARRGKPGLENQLQVFPIPLQQLNTPPELRHFDFAPAEHVY